MTPPSPFLLARYAAIVLFLFTARPAPAQIVLYQQNFDTLENGNGDVHFTTSATYNNITDSTVVNGIATGAAFYGNSFGNGSIASSSGTISAAQSGPYFVYEGTQDPGPSYADLVFSTAGSTINLRPNATYRFSFYLASDNLSNAAALQAVFNGTNLGTPVSNSVVGTFQHFTFDFNSGNAPTAVLELINQTVSGYGDDFGIDTISVSLVRGGLSTAGLDPNQRAIVGSLNGGINPLSIALINAAAANPSGYLAFIDQLSPLEFGRFATTTSFNNASFETQAMDDYLASRRSASGTFLGGNGTIDSSGFTYNDSSLDPTLAMVHSRLLAWNPTPARTVISDLPGPVMAGVDMKDTKEMRTPAANNPWNFFIRGNAILAQGFSQTDTGHFDDNTASVVLGADYRLTPNFLVGVKAGYGHTDVTLDNQGSSATVDSYSPGIYASYANQGWYANLTSDYAHNAYTQDRNISFLGQTASSAPEGNEGTVNLDGGYDFHRGAFTMGPIAGLQYTHLTIDGYAESGSLANLRVDEQQDDSLRSRLGGRLSYALHSGAVTFRPELDAAWQHEFLDSGRGITSQFDSTGLGAFTVRTENGDRESVLASVGLNVDFNASFTAFTNYMVQAGQSDYFGQSIQGGIRIGF